ncbi:MAG: glutamyl-tRNA reductase [Actinomycetota bacterium]|nr:glutamyl-tRNA reductase [Actinomycetota bacterium]
MSLVAVGVTQEEAPLDVFERLSIPDADIAKVLRRLRDDGNVQEAVVLSTCVRTEIYAVVDRFHDGITALQEFLRERSESSKELFGDGTCALFGDGIGALFDDAVPNHLFAVAAGLASPVPGETEVLGQVRRAWTAATEEGASGPVLSGLFRHALQVGKRVRTETAIARGVTSLSHAAVALARSRSGGSLAGRRVVVAGAGEMATGIVGSLASGEAGATGEPAIGLVVANRTFESARRLASTASGRGTSLASLGAELADADVLFTSLAVPAPVLDAAAVAAARPQGTVRELLVVDIGVPRNVDVDVDDIEGVTLLDMEDLRSFVDASIDGRRQEVDKAQAIVDEEVERYRAALAGRAAVPVVAALRERAEQIRRMEVAGYRARLEGLDDKQLDAVESLTRKILAKLLHAPTVHLKDAAGTPGGERLIEALRSLFEL